MELRKIKIKKGYQSEYIFLKTEELAKANINSKYPIECKLVNIKCLDKHPKATVSWHFKNVYRKLTYVYIDVDTLNDEYGPHFYLESSKLYSKTKLKSLRASDDFKNKRFAFFSYDFVEHLLGITTLLDHNFNNIGGGK